MYIKSNTDKYTDADAKTNNFSLCSTAIKYYINPTILLIHTKNFWVGTRKCFGHHAIVVSKMVV